MKTRSVVTWILVCAGLCPAATNYTWVGPDGGFWSNQQNWSPAGSPGLDPDDTVALMAETYQTRTIIVDVSCRVASIFAGGQFVLKGALDSAGDPSYSLESVLSNAFELDIRSLVLKGQVINSGGAVLKLRDLMGSFYLYNQGQVRWYDVNVLDSSSGIVNTGLMSGMDPGALICRGLMVNQGTLTLNSTNVVFENGATLTNEGTISGAGFLQAVLLNTGIVKSIMGDLTISNLGPLANEGRFFNEPGTHLVFTLFGAEFINRGQIQAFSGGGVSVFSSSLINEEPGLVQLSGGFLRAPSGLILKPFSSLQGRGELIGPLKIQENASADLYRTVTITRDVTIDPSAELIVADADVLVEGMILNNGILRLKSSRLIPRGGLSGDGQIVWEPSDCNVLTDFNLDGVVNFEDLATFSRTWLWRSPLNK